MEVRANPLNPWHHAEVAGRGYLTPEDIGDAIHAGADRDPLGRVVLEALADRKCEDWSLCAFVAMGCPER